MCILIRESDASVFILEKVNLRADLQTSGRLSLRYGNEAPLFGVRSKAELRQIMGFLLKQETLP